MELFKLIGPRGRHTPPHQQTAVVVNELRMELTKLYGVLERERAAQRRSHELNAGQGKLLEMIGRGVPLKDSLTELMLLIESQSDGVTCSTLLLDETGMLIRPGAAPNLPEEYTRALDGLPIGPTVGSCGTAMFLKKQVIVTNMMEDPLWAPYRQLIEPYGYIACWSTPIYLNSNEVLGAFAMYYRQQRSPDEHDMELIEFATHLAGIAIERTRREIELSRHRENLEDLIRIRTLELTEAIDQSKAANQSLNALNHSLTSALNDLYATQQELVQKEKLASLGALVAGIAHEMNTPVGNCMMAATNLSDRTRTLSDLFARGMKRSDLAIYLKDATYSSDIIVRNLQRAAELVTSFKQVAMDQATTQRRRFSVEEYVSNVITTLQPSIQNRSFVINQNIQKGIMMDGYPGALSRIVNQLINNAILHGFEGRESGIVSILAHDIGDELLELVITDNGNGISAEHQQRIFEPFFTTRRNLGGTGLGLHTVHNIVTGLMGGTIRVQSELEIGTTFYLTLPCIAPEQST